jgi:AbrB family looped-hinge helix DNA binding protein
MLLHHVVWQLSSIPHINQCLTIDTESGKVELCPTLANVKHAMSESHESPFARVRVDSAGRVVIPANVRQHLGIAAGQELILSEDAQGIRLQTFEQSVKAVQEAFAPYKVPGVSVVDELIREREEEARREYDQ